MEQYNYDEPVRVIFKTLMNNSIMLNNISNVIFNEKRVIFRDKSLNPMGSVEYSHLDCWYVQNTMKKIQEGIDKQ